MFPKKICQAPENPLKGQKWLKLPKNSDFCVLGILKAFEGSDKKIFGTKKLQLIEMKLFCDKSFYSQTPQKASKCPKHKNRYFSEILAIFDPLEGFRGSDKIFGE